MSSPKTLTLRLDDNYSKKLDEIRDDLKFKVNTEAIKNLIDIYPRYKEAIETIGNLKRQIGALQGEIKEIQADKEHSIKLKDGQIESIKKDISNFMTAFNDLKDLIE
jgi:hypothetical protein